MSADTGVIICISIKTCAQIDTVGGYGTGVSGGLRSGEQSAAAVGTADGAARVDAIDPGAARASGENFPVALRLLPARYRQHLMAVYGFARTTDDIGDRAPPDQRLGLLDELEADLRRLYARDAGGGALSMPAGSVGDAASAGDAGFARDAGSAGDAHPAGGAGAGRNAGSAGAGRNAGSAGAGGSGEVGGSAPGGGSGQVDGTDRGGGSGPVDGLAGDGGQDDGRAAGTPGLPRSRVVSALGPAVAECGIPIQPFLDLIQANRQDQVVARYQSFEDLVGYCRLSANPVGRIVLYVFGRFSQQRAELSDSVCTALQLAEHWQDVAEDLRAGRIYLPAEDLARHGCTEEDLAQPSASPAVRALLAFEVGRARAMLDAGAPLIGQLRGAARAAVAGYVAGGRAALAAIAAADYDVLRATPLPSKWRTARELVLAYARGR
jgi:squalene synthase HpnC